MLTYVESPLAFGLTRGMARAIGLNLTAAVAEGLLTRADLARLVDRCTACGQVTRCSAWLGSHVSAAALPDYCANRDELEALRG